MNALTLLHGYRFALSALCALLGSTATANAAVVNWVPNADGGWEIATNWTSNPALPGVADDVILDVGGVTVRTITHSVGNHVVNSLLSQENFTLSGGSLSLQAASTINGIFTQSSGSIGGSGTLTVTGAANLTFGDHRGTGTTILQGATSISGSGFRLDGGRVLQNDGTVTWSNSGLLFNNTFDGNSGGPGSGTINNRSGGVFIASGNGGSSISASNQGVTDTGADAVFNNAGTFRKSGSDATNTTNVSVAFNNTGTVDVQTGILNLTNGGTHTGSFTGAGTIGFGGGTQTLSGTSNVTTANV
ncbi:MAG: hypothetical protein HYX63_19190, partial [Gammaproteobacteria bacterium]|nr:hypothetical protein [Gammaproteobacteria bacterium]